MFRLSEDRRYRYGIPTDVEINDLFDFNDWRFTVDYDGLPLSDSTRHLLINYFANRSPNGQGLLRLRVAEPPAASPKRLPTSVAPRQDLQAISDQLKQKSRELRQKCRELEQGSRESKRRRERERQDNQEWDEYMDILGDLTTDDLGEMTAGGVDDFIAYLRRQKSSFTYQQLLHQVKLFEEVSPKSYTLSWQQAKSSSPPASLPAKPISQASPVLKPKSVQQSASPPTQHCESSPYRLTEIQVPDRQLNTTPSDGVTLTSSQGDEILASQQNEDSDSGYCTDSDSTNSHIVTSDCITSDGATFNTASHDHHKAPPQPTQYYEKQCEDHPKHKRKRSSPRRRTQQVVICNLCGTQHSSRNQLFVHLKQGHASQRWGSGAAPQPILRPNKLRKPVNEDVDISSDACGSYSELSITVTPKTEAIVKHNTSATPSYDITNSHSHLTASSPHQGMLSQHTAPP